MQLQAEGEALLGGYQPSTSPSSRVRGKSEPSSPVREKKPTGWYGSVKRAFSGTGRSATFTNARARFDDSAQAGSSASSPTKSQPEDDAASPRRAASDASFLRAKRGAKDWQTGDDDKEEETRGDECEREVAAGEEDDWDVERAAENRVVQLMFTVPRQRLRVVNADVDGRSLISFDDEEKLGKSELE